jgi:hypothetical protein
MEVRIGVRHVTREIVLETDQSADAVAKAVASAVAGGVLELTDTRGRRVMVPADALGYVDIGSEERRRVGFGS